MNRKIFNDLADYIMDTYDVNVVGQELKSFKDLIDHIDEKVVGEYFGDFKEGGSYWKPDTNWEFKRTGQQLIDKMNDREWDTWLDMGCGNNQYKHYWPDKVTGVDPFNTNADLVGDAESFKSDKLYDVVTVMGSINFGDYETIAKQMENVCSFCKPGGTMFFRFNPGITHDDPTGKAKWIDFFEWSPEYINEFASKFGFDVIEIGADNEQPEKIRYGRRIYSEWRKK